MERYYIQQMSWELKEIFAQNTLIKWSDPFLRTREQENRVKENLFSKWNFCRQSNCEAESQSKEEKVPDLDFLNMPIWDGV